MRFTPAAAFAAAGDGDGDDDDSDDDDGDDDCGNEPGDDLITKASMCEQSTIGWLLFTGLGSL